MLGQIKKFFLRTNTAFIGALVLSLIMLAAEYAPAIYKVLSDFDSSRNYTLESTSQYLGSFLGSLSKTPLADSLITALLWGAVGLALYTVFYLLANIYIDSRNQLYAAAEYSAEGANAKEVLGQAGGKLAAAIGYIVFVGLTLLYFIKFWMSLAYIYVFSGLHLSDLPYGLVAFVGLTLNLYLVIILAYVIWKKSETAVLYG